MLCVKAVKLTIVQMMSGSDCCLKASNADDAQLSALAFHSLKVGI